MAKQIIHVRVQKGRPVGVEIEETYMAESSTIRLPHLVKDVAGTPKYQYFVSAAFGSIDNPSVTRIGNMVFYTNKKLFTRNTLEGDIRDAEKFFLETIKKDPKTHFATLINFKEV